MTKSGLRMTATEAQRYPPSTFFGSPREPGITSPNNVINIIPITTGITAKEGILKIGFGSIRIHEEEVSRKARGGRRGRIRIRLREMLNFDGSVSFLLSASSASSA